MSAKLAVGNYECDRQQNWRDCGAGQQTVKPDGVGFGFLSFRGSRDVPAGYDLLLSGEFRSLDHLIPNAVKTDVDVRTVVGLPDQIKPNELPNQSRQRAHEEERDGRVEVFDTRSEQAHRCRADSQQCQALRSESTVGFQGLQIGLLRFFDKVLAVGFAQFLFRFRQFRHVECISLVNFQES